MCERAVEIIVVHTQEHIADVACRYNSSKVYLKIVMRPFRQFEAELVCSRIVPKAWVHIVEVVIGHKLEIPFLNVAEIKRTLAAVEITVEILLLPAIKIFIINLVDYKRNRAVIELVPCFCNRFAA